MRKYSLCIIDDKIPATAGHLDDTKELNGQDLMQLISDLDANNWSDPEVKEFISNILREPTFWNISAFTNPNIYMNHIEETLYIPDIVIYDWEYPGVSNSEECLLDILKKNFSLINIFTHVDKNDQVTNLINSDDRFKPYQNRIDILHKGNEDSVKELMDRINTAKESNFSFKFGAELRHKTIDSIEKILIELGKYSPDDVVWILGEEDKTNSKRKMSVNELVTFMVHKLRNELSTCKFGTDLPEVSSNPPRDPGDETIKNLWSFRLYYKPSDDLVRKGDIIRSNTADCTLYLVVSSDCHLCRFWSSNMGFLTLVPLHKVDKKNEILKTKLKLYKAESHYKNKVTVTSLTNTRNLDGPTIIPILRNSDGTYVDYLICPKELFSAEIPPPQNSRFNEIKNFLPLRYDDIRNYDGNNRITISEPFLTPLIQHILSNVTGYGVPDYPSRLQEIINDNIKGMF